MRDGMYGDPNLVDGEENSCRERGRKFQGLLVTIQHLGSLGLVVMFSDGVSFFYQRQTYYNNL